MRWKALRKWNLVWPKVTKTKVKEMTEKFTFCEKVVIRYKPRSLAKTCLPKTDFKCVQKKKEEEELRSYRCRFKVTARKYQKCLFLMFYLSVWDVSWSCSKQIRKWKASAWYSSSRHVTTCSTRIRLIFEGSSVWVDVLFSLNRKKNMNLLLQYLFAFLTFYSLLN